MTIQLTQPFIIYLGAHFNIVSLFSHQPPSTVLNKQSHPFPKHWVTKLGLVTTELWHCHDRAVVLSLSTMSVEIRFRLGLGPSSSSDGCLFFGTCEMKNKKNCAYKVEPLGRIRPLCGGDNAAFNWRLEVTRHCIDFALVQSMIVEENSGPSLDQSDAKSNQSRIGQLHFPALKVVYVFLFWALLATCNIYWMSEICCDWMVMLVLRHSIKKQD